METQCAIVLYLVEQLQIISLLGDRIGFSKYSFHSSKLNNQDFYALQKKKHIISYTYNIPDKKYL